MAPFFISTHRSLAYQGLLPQESLFTKSKMSPELQTDKPASNEDLPLIRYCETSIMKLRVGLWQIFRSVANCCTKVCELFRARMFFFVCVGKTVAMMGTLKKRSVEGLERPGGDPEMKVWMEEEEDDERESSSVIESDEDEGDEDSQSERDLESDEETDDDEEEEEEDCKPEDVESDWSDEEEDSEASAESLELWESFLNNSDPYNPLTFSSSTGSRPNTDHKNKTQTTPDTSPNTSSEDGRKKVRFSDRVTVRPLVAWAFASRAARDGSCWLQMARDRERFRRRAESVEALLKPCLSAGHRAAVWERLQC